MDPWLVDVSFAPTPCKKLGVGGWCSTQGCSSTRGKRATPASGHATYEQPARGLGPVGFRGSLHRRPPVARGGGPGHLRRAPGSRNWGRCRLRPIEALLELRPGRITEATFLWSPVVFAWICRDTCAFLAAAVLLYVDRPPSMGTTGTEYSSW